MKKKNPKNEKVINIELDFDQSMGRHIRFLKSFLFPGEMRIDIYNKEWSSDSAYEYLNAEKIQALKDFLNKNF